MSTISRLLKYGKEVNKRYCITEISCQSYEYSGGTSAIVSPVENIALQRVEYDTDIDEVEQALVNLSGFENEIIIYQFVHGKSCLDIAKILEQDKLTIKNARDRAIKKLGFYLS